jgi:hypothetical protein
MRTPLSSLVDWISRVFNNAGEMAIGATTIILARLLALELLCVSRNTR